MSKTLRAHLALFIVNALYGAGHLIAKGVMPDFISPAAFIFLRVACAVTFFWIIYVISGREKIDRKDLVRFLLCGLFGVALNQMCFFHGLSLSSSINSGIIMTMNPLMVLLLASIFLKDTLTPKKIVGIALAATGAIALTLNSGSISQDSMLGDLLLFINAISYAVYLIISKPLTKKYSPLTVITYVFSFGLFFVSIYPPSISQFSEIEFSQIPSDVWAKIAYVVFGITITAYLLTLYGLRRLKASATSSYIYFQPLFVIVFSYLFFYFNFTADYTGAINVFKISSMLLILGGVWLSTKESNKND